MASKNFWEQNLMAFTFASVQRQTEKAVLLNTYGWLPKSQVKFVAKDGVRMMVVPAWLAYKNRLPQWNVNGSPMGFSVDNETLMSAEDVTSEVLT